MGWITDLLKEYPALAVAKERLSLYEDQHKKLEAENAELRSKVAELESRLARHESPGEYQRRDGVDWKQDAQGAFTDGPRCPECKKLMSKMMDRLKCGGCSYEVYQGPPPLRVGENPFGAKTRR